MKDIIMVFVFMIGITMIIVSIAAPGAISEQERIYNKCLIEQQNKLYIEAVNTCKERVK